MAAMALAMAARLIGMRMIGLMALPSAVRPVLKLDLLRVWQASRVLVESYGTQSAQTELRLT